MVFFGGIFDEEPRRARPTFNTEDKKFLYQRQKGKCNGCMVKFPMRNMTVDHIKAFSKGGSDRPSNLQLLCNSCNSMKGSGTQAQLKKRLRAKGILKTAKRSSKTTKRTATTRKKTTSKRKPNEPESIFDLFRI